MWVNGREYNIPTVVKGKQLTGSRKSIQRQAEAAYFGSGRDGKLNRAMGRKKSPNLKNVTRSYKNPKIATAAAKKRSKAADKAHKKKTKY